MQVVDFDHRGLVAELVVDKQPDMLLTPDGRTLVVSLPGNPTQIAILDVVGSQLVT